MGTMEEIKSKISSLNKMQGVTVSEELLNQKTLQKLEVMAKEDFATMIQNIETLPKKIELA